MVEILISVLTKVAQSLVDPLQEEFGYLFTAHHNVEVLLKKIDDLVPARKRVEELEAEAIQQGDIIFPDVQEWLKATQEILRTREDFVIDEERTSMCCFQPTSRYNLSKRAKKQGEDIEAKLKQADRFTRDTVSHRPPPPPVTSSASSTSDAVFPSRELIINQIVEALRNEETRIVGVWGMGGAGKTTLAQQVAERAGQEKFFHKVVMASNISQNPNIQEIQEELAKTLGLRFQEGDNKSDALMNSMKNQKKILVILDDIWGKLDLGKIGIPYGNDHKGCKLLLTSREKDVVDTDMKAQRVFRLLPLEPKEAWSLFKTTAGDSVDYTPELKATADAIVKKCEGLPIAITTVANALKDKSLGVWKNALTELEKAKPTNVRGMSHNVYSCLGLSYDHLEGDEVKSLFLLCGLLGGRRISMDHLLLYATGLNMFDEIYSMEDATNRVTTLVQKLIASSLLLEAEGRDNDKFRSLFFDDSFVKMHDVVRDFARSIASKDRQYVVSKAVELREWERRGECRNYRGISLECEVKDELPPTLVCPELELFLLSLGFDASELELLSWISRLDSSEQENISLNLSLDLSDLEALLNSSQSQLFRSTELRIPEDFFQGVTKLRVMHMSVVSLRPSSLGFLSNLRTLCLNNCQLQDMIIIGEMKKLLALSLAKSTVVELPKEIMQLKDLRVLDLQDCAKLRIIPRNVLSSLSSLECLSLRGCDKIEWGRDGDSKNNKACVSEIKDLHELRNLELQVSDSSFLPEDIGLDLVNLTRYAIMIGDEGLTDMQRRLRWGAVNEGCAHLLNKFPRILTAGGVKVPVVLLKSFFNLFKTSQFVLLVNLDGISNVVYDLADENGFPQLECLTIEECGTIRHIVSSSLQWIPPRDTFCRLDRLSLFELPDLESVFHFHERAAVPMECFGKLRFLSLTHCEKLRCVMSLPMQHGKELNFCPRLQKLELFGLPNLISFYSSATHEDSQQVPMPILFGQQAAFLALEELRVEWMDLRALWHNQFPVDSFSKLKKLEFENCKGLQNVFPVSLVKALVQLEELEIRLCESLQEIVANEGHEDIEDEAVFFPKFTHLKLGNLLLLKRFCSGTMKLRWPLLNTMSVCECDDQVRTVFEEISLAGEVDAQPLFLVEKEAFPNLEELEIETLKGVVEIWRGHFSRVSFSKLRVLNIDDCHGISFVISGNMVRTLHNLEELRVSQCYKVKEVIQLPDDEPTTIEIDFSKLKSLHLSNLPNLKGFCSTTCNLTSLEDLDVSDCHMMEFFCKGVLHIRNDTLKEYILGCFHSNTQAFHETSTVDTGLQLAM